MPGRSRAGLPYVVGEYRCWCPSDQMNVWVSVKQGGPDPTAEGSSRTVDARRWPSRRA